MSTITLAIIKENHCLGILLIRPNKIEFLFGQIFSSKFKTVFNFSYIYDTKAFLYFLLIYVINFVHNINILIVTVH